jgi:hypothetical protein
MALAGHLQQGRFCCSGVQRCTDLRREKPIRALESPCRTYFQGDSSIACLVEGGDKRGPVVTRTEFLARLEFPAKDSDRDVGATGRSAAAVAFLSGALAPDNAARQHLNPEDVL